MNYLSFVVVKFQNKLEVYGAVEINSRAALINVYPHQCKIARVNLALCFVARRLVIYRDTLSLLSCLASLV